MGDTIHVSVELHNNSEHNATEVVQLYVLVVSASVARQVKELKAFRRVRLKAGELRNIELALPTGSIAFYNIDMKKVVKPGEFRLWVGSGSSVQDGLSFWVE